MNFDRNSYIVAGLIRASMGRLPKRVLVVGCGTGREAAQLAVTLGAEVIGIDIHPRWDPGAAAVAKLQYGDATALDFPDGSFDLVYSYHALEHIPDFRRALREMKRVLTPDGYYFVGTPNRHRLIGYLGSRNTSLRKKILWNASDWKARLRGKFRNDYGAHAGFTRAELQSELSRSIGPAINMTMSYYLSLYARKATYGRLLDRLWLSSLLLPAIYFVGGNGEAAANEQVPERDGVVTSREAGASRVEVLE
jgi:SAM-dependent methyltransferase